MYINCINDNSLIVKLLNTYNNYKNGRHKMLELDKRYPSETIREYSYRILKKNIVFVNIQPGEAISENIIASVIKVSRTPIRETFSRLLNDGLLEIYPQQGTYVSLIDMKRVDESVFMRLRLEKDITQIACKGISEENMFLLESNLNQQIFCYERNRLQEFFLLDNKMHEIIYHACNMDHIWQAISSISADQSRIRFLELFSKVRCKEILDEHKRIVSLIKNKSSSNISELIAHHISVIYEDVQTVKKKYPDYFRN